MTINTDTPVELLIALDDRLALIQELITLQDQEERVKTRIEAIKRELKASIPVGHVATVGGAPIYKHSRTDQFATDVFRRAHPEWHEFYLQPVVKPTLNLVALRGDLPQVDREFSVYKLTPVGNRASLAMALGLPSAA